MKYEKFINAINDLITNNNKLYKQTHIMFIPLINKSLKEDSIGEEIRVQYDISRLWKEFEFKENKVLFFIDKYLKFLIDGVKAYDDIFDKELIYIPSNQKLDEAIYYFDSLIASFSTLIEPQHKDALSELLNRKKINEIFPTRKEAGLFWQIYMLRNRILHYTGKRYTENKDECTCYCDFSSKINMINIDAEKSIHLKSTLIDIYKCPEAVEAIEMAIVDKDVHPFEVLFPNTKAIGRKKRKPFVNSISNDIFFDHASSEVDLINEMHKLFDSINKLFLENLLIDEQESESILDQKTEIIYNNEKINYSVRDVYR